MRTPRRRQDPSVPLLAAIAAIVALVSIWLALALAPAKAASVEHVPVRGWTHESFGRLVFDWQSPVGYTARAEDGRLVVEFERAGSFAWNRALANLATYLSSVESSADGRRAIFQLARPVTLKSFTDGPKVVVDLRPALAEPHREESEKPLAESAPARTADAVHVRAGEHDGFSRLVFDWPERVSYEITRQGDVVLVSFHHSGRLDLRHLSANPPRAVTSIDAAVMADRVVARLTLPAGATLRDFVNGTSVVIDVLTSAPSGKRPQAEVAAAAQGGLDAPSGALQAPGASQSFASAPPAPGAPTQLVPPMPQATAPAQATPVAAAAEAPVAAAEVRSSTEPAKPEVSPVAAAADGKPPVIPVAIVPEADGVRLQVAWPEPVSAAAFRRAGIVWLVFDRPSRFDLTAVIASGHPALGTVKQVEHPSASILQFSGDRVATPRLVSEGTSWIIDFRAGSEGPLATLQPTVGWEGVTSGRIRVAVADPSRPVETVDPEVGDRLIVVALRQQGSGVAPGQEWPDLALLPTQQGIVVAPRRDDVVVETMPDGVVIRREGGLLVSREAVEAPQRQTASAQSRTNDVSAGPQSQRLFDLVSWRHEDKDFATARQELQSATLDVEGPQQNIARLDLARFYFAHGLATEAAGLIDLISVEAPGSLRDPELLLLSGVGDLLHDDLGAAREKLLSRVLDGEPEAELWRAALAASNREWDRAGQGFARSFDLVDTYPHVIRARLMLLAAEAAIESGDPGAAAMPLDKLREDAPTPDEAAQLAYLEGLKAEREGRLDEAESIWRTLTETNHQPTRARAIFGLTELMLRQGRLQMAEAIERMERVRFVWRGGPFEFTVLRRLGQLYLAEGKPREGLTVLRQAVAAYPDHPDAQALAGEMTDAFRDIYLGEGGSKVPPLVAVSLYDEFRELTPAGAEGDRLIAGLADRLVEVDLLERADKLLDYQIRYRLHGHDRAETGARLAEIRLRDRRPDDALAALRASAAPGLPDSLVRHRNHLRARALFQTGEAAEALALLENDSTVEGIALRADMLWRLHEWAGAAEALGELLKRPTAETSDELAARRAGLVLNRAIALTLAGNGPELRRLASQYGEAVEGTVYAEPFKLLTDSAGDMTTRPIAEQLASASRLETLFAEYRQQAQAATASPEG